MFALSLSSLVIRLLLSARKQSLYIGSQDYVESAEVVDSPTLTSFECRASPPTTIQTSALPETITTTESVTEQHSSTIITDKGFYQSTRVGQDQDFFFQDWKSYLFLLGIGLLVALLISVAAIFFCGQRKRRNYGKDMSQTKLVAKRNNSSAQSSTVEDVYLLPQNRTRLHSPADEITNEPYADMTPGSKLSQPDAEQTSDPHYEPVQVYISDLASSYQELQLEEIQITNTHM
ncbi:hypothetical protein EB796_015630 [Bugula neritina]|uniref:Uncharacterized protein n=1 Tax=Bugula neritina TaxID=10212 RepID=A0A7J7JKB1_BUGNE|nr:hypothetical protein EB796_015630 [Bugula neritina]